MKLLEILPFIRFADRISGISQYTDFVMAYDYRLIYMVKGTICCTFEDISYSVSENQILIIPPATKYMLQENLECDFIVLNFDMDCTNSEYSSSVTPCYEQEFDSKNILSVTLYNDNPLRLSCNDFVKHTLKEIVSNFTTKDIYYQEKCSALLKSIIVESIIFTNLDKTPKIVDDVKKFIEENYEKDITNGELGDKFRYHPNHLNRLFKAHTKMSLHEFIIDVRLTKASDMINNSDLSISQIGELCGFSSGAYFIKKFKDKYGIPPLKFRNQKFNKI